MSKVNAPQQASEEESGYTKDWAEGRLDCCKEMGLRCCVSRQSTKKSQASTSFLCKHDIFVLKSMIICVKKVEPGQINCYVGVGCSKGISPASPLFCSRVLPIKGEFFLPDLLVRVRLWVSAKRLETILTAPDAE